MPDLVPDEPALAAMAEEAGVEAPPKRSAGAFRSLSNHNFRIWSAGALVSNVGAWMQRIAQDWLVLTVLTNHNSAAVGLVTALQFGPQVLLVAWTGHAADHFDRRRMLFLTQSIMAILALGLGALTVSGWVQAWHVYIFAFVLGCAAAFDAPARQTFVSDLVSPEHLSNAVAINATSFNASRLIGPAVAGLIIAAVGSGWAFILNGASFMAVLASLSMLKIEGRRARDRTRKSSGGFIDGFRYLGRRPDLKALLVMFTLFGTFGLNYTIFISSMAASVFHLDAKGYGLLSSAIAVGAVGGALLAARRERPTSRLIAIGAAIFGVAYAVAAVMPGPILFGAALVVVGAASQTVTTSTMALVQTSTDPRVRGRIVSLVLTAALGGQPIGAPLCGWIANAAGPRFAVAVGAITGIVVSLLGFRLAAAQAKGEIDGGEAMPASG